MVNLSYQFYINFYIFCIIRHFSHFYRAIIVLVAQMKKEVFIMLLNGALVGDIRISVYKTPDNKIFFYVNADNKDVLPVVYVIEDTLSYY